MALLNWLRKAVDIEKIPCLPQPTDVPGVPSTTVKAVNIVCRFKKVLLRGLTASKKERVSTTCTVPRNDWASPLMQAIMKLHEQPDTSVVY